MSRFNTGNPLDSNDPRDLDDNAKNMDLAVNSEADTFQDRLGKSRLTWTGIVKAGSGDPAIAVDAAARAEAAASQVQQDADQIAADAAQQAVTDVVNAVDGAVDRAEAGADRAEIAAIMAEDAAQYDYFVSEFSDLAEIQDPVAAQRAFVRSSERVYRFSGSHWIDQGLSPSAAKANKSDPVYGFAAGDANIRIDTAAKTVEVSGRVIAGGRSVFVDPPQVMSYESPGANQIIGVNSESGALVLHSAASPLSIGENVIVLGVLSVATGDVYGADNYELNGALVSLPGLREYAQQANRAPIGELHGIPSGVSVDTSAMTITFTGGRVLAPRGQSVLIPNHVVSIPTNAPATRRYLICNLSSGLVSIVGLSSLPGLGADDCLIGSIYPATGELVGIDYYRLNGREVSIASLSTKPNTLPSGVPLARDASDIDFQFASNKIIVSQNITVPYGDLRVLVTPQELDISGLASPTWGAIFMDPESGALSWQPTSALITSPGVMIGAILKSEKRVVGFDLHSVDGVPNTDGGDTSIGQFDNVMGGWDYSGVFNSPAMPNYSTSGGSPVWYDITTAMVVSWYDELVADHPDYVTKSLLGTDPDGVEIFEYRFSPKTAVTPIDRSGHLLKVMLQSGVHGSEKIAILYLYNFMKLLSENWMDDPALEAIRHSVEFSVVPTVAPWTIDNTSRVNSRGVNINRNYPAGWTLTEEGQNYSGTAPLSEPETVASYEHMQNFNPHLFFDCHNYSGTAEGRFIWVPTVSEFNRAAGVATINRLAVKWKKENDWMPDASNLGYTTLSANGTAGMTASTLGILGSTFEIADRLHLDPSGTLVGTSLVIRYGVETLGNMLLIMLRKIAA